VRWLGGSNLLPDFHTFLSAQQQNRGVFAGRSVLLCMRHPEFPREHLLYVLADPSVHLFVLVQLCYKQISFFVLLVTGGSACFAAHIHAGDWLAPF
jgi:hypothetical protein